MIYNFAVRNRSLYANTDLFKHLFAEAIEIVYLTTKQDMFDILVAAKVFRSRSDAKKNWKTKEIPKGYIQLFIGKQKTEILIFNPKSRKEIKNEAIYNSRAITRII